MLKNVDSKPQLRFPYRSDHFRQLRDVNASRSGSSRTIVTEEVGISGPDPARPSGAAHTADYAAHAAQLARLGLKLKRIL